jgi:hypothetical protein
MRGNVRLLAAGLVLGATLLIAFTGFHDTVTEYEAGERSAGRPITMSCSSIAAGGEHRGDFLMNVEWVPGPCVGEATARRRIVLGDCRVLLGLAGASWRTRTRHYANASESERP